MSAITVGSVKVGEDHPLVLIAGPDTAESRDLVLETCEALLAITRPLGVPLIFKASFLKANRSSGGSYRGPGRRQGLEMLAEAAERFGVPVTTDVHETDDVAPAAEVADLIQIPAFLCRQTPLVIAAARSGRAVNIKKGPFMAPASMHALVAKVTGEGNPGVLLTERGTTFGYHDLVVDMRGLAEMGRLGTPVIFDATHATQRPGAGPDRSGGQRQYAAVLARGAVGAGVAGLFFEVHPDPSSARCDAEVQLRPDQADRLLQQVVAIDAARRTSTGNEARALPTPGEEL
jgi:2-dehydro-3-deoxyphosphooctonate aldolase (KDO 8-P synthase)